MSEYSEEKAQFAPEDLKAGGDIANIVKGVREVKGADDEFDLGDLVALGPKIVGNIVSFFGYIAKGDPTDPNDDAFIAERVISSGTAFGRGTEAFRKIGTSEEPG